MSDQNSGGFTLIEVMIVVLIFVPILIAVSTTTGSVSSTINANDRRADVVETLRRSTQRIGQFIRPISMTTLRLRAIQADVDAGKATTVGEWIEPTDFEGRAAIRFQSADGVLSMSASALTQVRSVLFTLDGGELDNDLDDDGDGKIDEGRVHLVYDGTRLTLADDIEVCTFTVEGRLLRVALQGVREDKKGHLHRARIVQTFYMRNN